MDRLKKIFALLLVLAALVSLGGPAALADAEASEEPVGESALAEPSAAELPDESTETPDDSTETPDESTETPDESEEPLAVDEPASEEAMPEVEPEAETAASDEASDEPEKTPAERVWIEPGNTDAEITDGGRFLRADGVLYYADGGIWADENGNTRLVTAEEGQNLNLVEGWLYYTIGSGDVRRVPAAGGASETVYSFGASIKQLYVMGTELRFLADGCVWSYDLETETLSPVEAPAHVFGLIPTPRGNVYLTGEVLNYTVWAGTQQLCSGVQQLHRDGEWLVLVKDGETLQATIEGAFSGAFSLSAYRLHSELSVSNGLSDEQQLENEAAYLHSEDYALLQDGLTLHWDGAYTATNSNIVSTAYASASLTTNQKNIVLRARQMAEVEWTPLKWRYSWGGDDSSYVSNNSGWGSKVTATDGTTTYGYFSTGKTYRGVPYSQAVNTGYVGWNISLDGFVQAVNNSSSNFYNGYSHYSRTAPYYGSDCSGFASYAWDTAYRCTCTTLLHFSTYIGKSLSSIQIGDVFNKPSSHVVLVTNIGYDANGNINAVEITEQTPCKMRVTCYGELFPGKTYQYTGSLSYLTRYYLNGSYAIYRRAASNNVSFTPSSAVELEESGYASAPRITVAVNSEGNAKVVTLSHSVSGAAIYYTTDGSKPTSSSTKYTAPFSVTKDTTVRAIAVLGSPYTGSYELNYKVTATKAEAPFIVLVEGDMQDSYVSNGSVVKAVNHAGDTIYYTTDGSTPTTKSKKMTDYGITINKDMTLKAIAVSDSNLNSDPATITVKIGTFYDVVATTSSGGYITPSGRTGVLKGSSCTFEIVPLDHFVIDDVKVDGTSVGKRTSYTFRNVSGVHTISASFSVSLPFTDVKTGWFVENVAFAYSHDLFSGTTSTTFSPNSYMTRGMFITVLGRFAGNGRWSELENWSGCLGITNGSSINIREQTNTSDTSVILGRTGGTGQFVHVLSIVPSGLDGARWYKINTGSVTGYVRGTTNDSTGKTLLRIYTGSFNDLPGGMYYTGYAQWANINGLMSGVTDTTFCPNQYIKRQDICLMFYRYITVYLGRSLGTSSTKFTDDASIGSYAKTAVYAMKSVGIVNGYEDGSFRPNGYATRAEVATMFANLYNYLYGG